MAAGSKDHPPMLGPGRYSQWRSRFLRSSCLAATEANEIEGIAIERHKVIIETSRGIWIMPIDFGILPCKVFQEALQPYQINLSNFFKLGTRLKITRQGINNNNQSGQFGNHKDNGLLFGARGNSRGRKPTHVQRLLLSQEKDDDVCKQAEPCCFTEAEQLMARGPRIK
ncbi:hypothetical protein Tco_0459008 [Tanacetum coccineum]